ncbi:hypothetical protein LSAT2_005528 [Lamellibrachia satsuma]|nr:hypothetical protein LSAT2_005528 [Lamellibrachia satsuma]
MRAMDGKVYIGDLLETVKREELEKQLSRFGRVMECWVAHNPPGFAFAEFANVSDAECAVKALDGKNVCGSRVRVEMAQRKGQRLEARPHRPLLGAKGTLHAAARKPVSIPLLSTPLLSRNNGPMFRERRPLLGAHRRPLLGTQRRPLLASTTVGCSASASAGHSCNETIIN